MFASWSTSIINLLGTVGKVETLSGTGNAARTEVRSEGSKAKHATGFIPQAMPGITGGEKWSQRSRVGRYIVGMLMRTNVDPNSEA